MGYNARKRPFDSVWKIKAQISLLISAVLSRTSFIISNASNITYSKTCVKRLLKNRQNKDLNDKWNSLMKVESIAECSPWNILQYFEPALSDNWSWKPIFYLFESGRFTQVLLYTKSVREESVVECIEVDRFSS